MIRTPRLILATVLATLATACVERPEASAEFFVFGTLVDVQLPDAGRSEATPVFTALQQEFQRMHREWHAWEPGELVELNQALHSGQGASTTADIGELIRLSREMEVRSGGRFNAAIGGLIALWGFHTSDFPIHGPPPPAGRIRAIVEARPSARDIEFRGGRVWSSNPQVQFDFGGIAKGYAVDLACGFIRGFGQQSAIINAGGDVRTMGDNHGRPWRVAVRDPGGGVAGTVEVSGDFAVFTSGNYERFREDAEKRFPHILDPRTGWPVDGISSATVIARDGALADAAATALVVAGTGEWPQVASEMGIEAALVIDDSGAMFATPAMLDYFTPSEGREPILTSEPSP